MKGSPGKLLVIGFALLLFGALMPFAMVMGWVRSTLLFNAASAIASLSGSVIGLYGLFMYVQRRRND